MSAITGTLFGTKGPSTGGPSDQPPKKYIKVDGVTQLNPAYKAWKEGKGQQSSTAPAKALPVVSTMEDHAALNKVSKEAGDGPVKFSPATDATIEMMQEAEVCQQVGLSSDAMVDGLGAIFAKYEAPIGLMNKLMGLGEYHEMEFMIDDSGSMNATTDTRGKDGKWMSRWQEAQMRLKQMIEVLAYVPTPPMTICFLNSKATIHLKHKGETPEKFLEFAHKEIDRVFGKVEVKYTTPAAKRLSESIRNKKGKKVIRYFFGDGVPDGGDTACKAIRALAKARPDPQGNPLTFISCTDQDDDVEWMKETEEIAPFCSESDDYRDERREVLRDQGNGLPFTRGFHLICQLVAAMNPNDLDAMDESVPFTKWSLDNLLGIKITEKEFRHYFEQFKEAQNKRTIESPMDRFKKKMNWELHYNDFLQVKVAKNIQAVQTFKDELKKYN